MNFLLLIVQSPGYIFGPLMLLAGVAAAVVCARATRHADRVRAIRALTWSLAPVALGVLGAIVGGIVWALADRPATDPARAWAALGCTILFGAIVAAVPVAWSLALLRRRPLAPAL